MPNGRWQRVVMQWCNEMKVIINKYIPFGDFLAITLFGVVFAKRELDKEESNHEAIHIRQGNEMLWIFFYLFYVIEWLIRLIQYRDKEKAYYNISFEREAYSNQHNLNYLNSQKWYSWVKYITSKHI